MKNLSSTFALAIILLCFANASTAQTAPSFDAVEVETTKTTERKIKLTGTADASMLQMALLEIGGKQQVSTPRYSYFWNGGFHANLALSNSVYLFSGLNIKNLGFILRDDSLINKYRTYTIGAPLGLKIGNLNKAYAIFGGGVDFPFNYKEKHIEIGNRSNKVKADEWLSDKTNTLFAYAFLGYRFANSFTAKLIYYPTNFWSDSYVKNNQSNIFVLTIGFDVNNKIKDAPIQIDVNKD